MKFKRYDVYLDDILMDTVSYLEDVSEEEVIASLVQHDHYPDWIRIKEQKKVDNQSNL